jgi:aerotaxis receptor
MSNEIIFERSDVFFSVTDTNSNIIYANDTFCKIAQYKFEELQNQPHNIVRHEDTPKIIFKLFWNMLKQDKPIVAYVKNKTKNGDYYWVLGTALPIKDINGNIFAYLSIRIFPESKYFEVMKNLYKHLIDIEKQYPNDWENKSQELLDKSLKNLGYDNYEALMLDILRDEIDLKKEIIVPIIDESSIDNDYIKEFPTYIDNMIHNAIDIIDNANSVVDYMDMVNKDSDDTIYVFDDIVISSLNSNLAAVGLGREGAVFNTITSFVQTFSNNASEKLTDISTNANNLNNNIIVEQTVYVSAMYSYLLSVLIKQEIKDYVDTGSSDFKAFYYAKYVATHTIKIERLIQLLTDIRKLNDEVSGISANIKPLTVLGKIEGANSNNDNFSNIMESINRIVLKINETSINFDNNLNLLSTTISDLDKSSILFARNTIIFSLQMMAYDHEKFVKNVEKLSKDKINKELSTHLNCVFGQYYYGDLKQVLETYATTNALKYFKDIEQYHINVHKLGQEALIQASQDTENLNHTLEQLEENKDKVVEFIKNIQSEISFN